MTSPRHDPALRCHPIIMHPAPHMTHHHVVEVGPGNGDFLLHIAAAHPDWHCIGIELKEGRFDTVLRRAQRAQLHNISLLHGDAAQILPGLAQHLDIQCLYILFPDPWPKRRHAKHRLMQRDFVRRCIAALPHHGMLCFTTDDEPYARATATIIAAHTEMASVYDPVLCINPPDLFPSYFAQKWRDDGRTIYAQQYVKSGATPQPVRLVR